MPRVYPVFAIALLNAMGIGLVQPVLPQLFRQVGHTSEIGWSYGVFLSVYALLQFLASPVLGAASDRWGRRRILLVSLAGAAADYALMAAAPSLGWLYAGRVISGVTGATTAVATAYLSDISAEGQRTRRFAQMSACFGVGFIVGPVLGALLGDLSPRAPFVTASVLSALTWSAVFLVMPESRARGAGEAAGNLFNLFAPLRWLTTLRTLMALVLAFVVMAAVGEVGGTIWVIYGQEKFAWDNLTVGLSLAGFGVFHALAQAFVAGPVSDRWGEKGALIVGIGSDSAAYVLIALATKGWMPFLLFPLFCLGGIGAPALQSLMSARVGEDRQGQLQGVITSLTSLVSVVAPLAILGVYFGSRRWFPGLVWVLGAGLYGLCLPLLARGGLAKETEGNA